MGRTREVCRSSVNNVLAGEVDRRTHRFYYKPNRPQSRRTRTVLVRTTAAVSVISEPVRTGFHERDLLQVGLRGSIARAPSQPAVGRYERGSLDTNVSTTSVIAVNPRVLTCCDADQSAVRFRARPERAGTRCVVLRET